MTPMKRRGFFKFLTAAPFVGPLLVKAGFAETTDPKPVVLTDFSIGRIHPSQSFNVGEIIYFDERGTFRNAVHQSPHDRRERYVYLGNGIIKRWPSMLGKHE